MDDDSDGEADTNPKLRMCHLNLGSMVICQTAYSCVFCCLFKGGKISICEKKRPEGK